MAAAHKMEGKLSGYRYFYRLLVACWSIVLVESFAAGPVKDTQLKIAFVTGNAMKVQ
jgi:hypothetical protein